MDRLLVVCAVKLNRTVRIFNLGGREEWQVNYEVGFDDSGLISALNYKFYLSSASFDTLMNKVYFIANYQTTANICYSNIPPRTYMRALGHLQACLGTGMVMERVATELLGLPVTTVQERSFIKDGESAICGRVRCTTVLGNYVDVAGLLVYR